MTVPGSTEGPNQGTPSGASSNQDALLPHFPTSQSLPGGANSQWLINYYNALYPNGPPPTPEDLAMLNRSLCGMINNQMSEMNTQYQKAKQYAQDVAKGNE